LTLRVQSRAITPKELGISSFTELLGSNTTAFLQEDQGLIGWGEAKRLSANGANRITDLDAEWQQVISQASIEDSANLRGSGLVAFGTISFADQSQAQSVLVIPSLVIGCFEDQYWITLINIEFEQALKLINKDRTSSAIEFKAGSISPEQFESNVVDALISINENNVEKVVLARDLVAQAKDFNPNAGLFKLSKKYETCYTYLVDGMFGSSPELLVRVENKMVRARVLAGTAGRGTDPEVDKAIGAALLSSHKNRAEHKFAIDSLTSSMKSLCSSITVSEAPFSLSLPNLWHLASDVSAEINQSTTSLQLLDHLHPSAAVAGTPRLQALELITQIEKIDRGRYAGPVGWLSANGDGTWAIALRGAQYELNTVRAFAGCGIVSESDPQAELAETNLKFKPILDSLT
jgi:menaquinone-specific isochorismate synthase